MVAFRLLFVGVSSMVLFVSGCGPPTPTGFPPLKHCMVTVTNGGSPIEGVAVLFASAAESVFIAGTTNASGTAIMETSKGNYTRAGVPSGDYSIVLSKNIEVNLPKLSEEEQLKLTPAQQEARDQEFKKQVEAGRVIPVALEDVMKTPLTAKIGDADNKIDIDVAQYKK